MPVSPTALSTKRAASPLTRSDARASALLGWSALAIVLTVGLPIFLCMPVSFDVSHYDICARNLLRGGIHYKDTFDNNLPGIVWLQAGIRWLIGWKSESLRTVDLLFFSIDVLLLLPWVRRGAEMCPD